MPGTAAAVRVSQRCGHNSLSALEQKGSKRALGIGISPSLVLRTPPSSECETLQVEVALRGRSRRPFRNCWLFPCKRAVISFQEMEQFMLTRFLRSALIFGLALIPVITLAQAVPAACVESPTKRTVCNLAWPDKCRQVDSTHRPVCRAAAEFVVATGSCQASCRMKVSNQAACLAASGSLS
jgi:hypothetical protein